MRCCCFFILFECASSYFLSSRDYFLTSCRVCVCVLRSDAILFSSCASFVRRSIIIIIIIIFQRVIFYVRDKFATMTTARPESSNNVGLNAKTVRSLPV